MISELLETCRNNENTMSDLYFNEKSHCSEENTSDNEDFHSTILQPFQFEREQKKRVIMRAITKKLQKQSFADILQNRCFEKFRKFRIKTPVLKSLFKAWRPATLRRKDSNTGVFLWNLRNFENTFFIEHLQSLLLKLNIFMLQLPIFYILEFEVSIGMRAMRKKLNIFILQLPIYYILE